MIHEYPPDQWLPLSGIQHFCFCRRQWALIYIEQQWRENVLTVEGKLLHQRVNDPLFYETRSGVIITRSMPISSCRLGLSGICDVVEFTLSPEGISLPGRQGTYQPIPVEYKRGVEKKDKSDEAQLCAQALCLEEMLSTHIPFGYLYYGQTRHRVRLELTSELRDFVIKMALEMHSYMDKGYTPRVKTSKACKSCSLEEICLPALQGTVLPASKYIQMHMDEK